MGPTVRFSLRGATNLKAEFFNDSGERTLKVVGLHIKYEQSANPKITVSHSVAAVNSDAAPNNCRFSTRAPPYTAAKYGTANIDVA